MIVFKISGDDFSIDEVRSRLHGQLEIQPIVGGSHQGLPQPLRPPSNMPPWLSHAPIHGVPPSTGRTPPPAHTTTSSKAFATSSSNDGTGTGSEGHHSDPDDPRNYRLPLKRGRETPNNGFDNHWGDNNGRPDLNARGSPLTPSAGGPPPRSRSRPSSSSSASAAASASNAALMAAAQAAGMPLSALDPSDPMSSMNALLAAAQVRQDFFSMIKA